MSVLNHPFALQRIKATEAKVVVLEDPSLNF